MRSRPPIRTTLVVLLALSPVGASPLGAQQVPPAPSAQETEPPTTQRGPSPGGAFLRAILVPGWGHASIGSHHRGGFYFASEATTVFGLVKTRNRLREARDRLATREAWLTRQATLDGIEDPEEIAALLDEDVAREDLLLLVDAREQQQEDWVAFGIFLLFLSGADAFVSAHLQAFPSPLEIDADVVEGRLQLGVSLRVPD